MIEYCLSNVDADVRARLLAIESAREHPCLDHCGHCYDRPFAVIDGEFATVESHAVLLEGIDG